MKIKEILEKSDVELGRLLAELQSRLQDLRFNAAGRSLTRVREMRTTRRDIARILTVRRGRELSGESDATAR
ncbi:MAG: 50S ribosomal protein L29 [bacterium]